MNVEQHRREELRALFPSVFTLASDGESEVIDFEKLRAELGLPTDTFENRRERYGMDWPGKKDCLRLIQKASYGTLRPQRDQSVEFDSTGNVFVEGDNLEVLKLLQKSLYGSVKLIYIDPP